MEAFCIIMVSMRLRRVNRSYNVALDHQSIIHSFTTTTTTPRRSFSALRPRFHRPIHARMRPLLPPNPLVLQVILDLIGPRATQDRLHAGLRRQSLELDEIDNLLRLDIARNRPADDSMSASAPKISLNPH